jgi:hypothetical protein
MSARTHNSRLDEAFSISTNYSWMVLFGLSVVTFMILCMASIIENFTYLVGGIILCSVYTLAFLFRKCYEVEWIRFSRKSVFIRGGHGFFELERGEIQSIEVMRSPRDEESIFVPAYKLLFQLNRGARRSEALSSFGFEISFEGNAEILIYRFSGVKDSQADLEKFVSSWLENSKGLKRVD